MSDDDTSLDATTQHDGANDATTGWRSVKLTPASSFFSIPPPLKRVFDRFPLTAYAENEQPLRAPHHRDSNVLHIFTTPEDARKGRPSFNPACLKWQTYMKISGLSFITTSSTNHASPSGALPFLLANDPKTATESPGPIPSNKLRKWLATQKSAEKIEQPVDARSAPFATLVDDSVRKAWLYQLYLHPLNSSVAARLYVEPCSSNIFVQMSISRQLRQAAEHELTKFSASNTIDESSVMLRAADAFSALSTLLGSNEWFFDQPGPGLFDASVFAYTHLILDNNMQWEANGLEESLMGYGNLVQHRYRILEMYY